MGASRLSATPRGIDRDSVHTRANLCTRRSYTDEHPEDGLMSESANAQSPYPAQERVPTLAVSRRNSTTICRYLLEFDISKPAPTLACVHRGLSANTRLPNYTSSLRYSSCDRRLYIDEHPEDGLMSESANAQSPYPAQ